jgi:hypothetical protein
MYSGDTSDWRHRNAPPDAGSQRYTKTDKDAAANPAEFAPNPASGRSQEAKWVEWISTSLQAKSY